MRASKGLTVACQVASTIALAGLLLLVGLAIVAPWALGVRYLTMYGASMEPAVPLGSLAIVRPVAAGAVHVGDVVVYRPRNESAQFVTHRVIEAIPGTAAPAFRTKGDANAHPDSDLVTGDRLVGKVVLYVPALGYAVHYVRTPVGSTLLVLLLLTGIGLVIWQEIPRPRTDTGNITGKDRDPAAGAGSRLWLLVLLGLGTLAAAGTGVGRALLSDSERASIEVAASIWTPATTLELEATAEGSIPLGGASVDTLSAGTAAVSGQVQITNRGSAATHDLAVNVQVQQGSLEGFEDLAAASAEWSSLDLGPGAGLTLPYEIGFASAPNAVYRVRIRVTITNYEGHIGERFGPEVTVPFSLSAAPEPTGTPSPTPLPTETATTQPTPTPGPTEPTEPEETPTSEATATPEPTPEGDVPSTPEPTPEGDVTAAPEQTPERDATPTPTPELPGDGAPTPQATEETQGADEAVPTEFPTPCPSCGL